MKTKIFYLLCFLIISFAISFAGGGGGNNGGGSCGKGGCQGGGGNQENVWQTISTNIYMDNSNYPGGLEFECATGGIFPQQLMGAGVGLNTYPIILPTALGSSDYFSQVLVQDLTTGETRQQEPFLSSTSWPISVPKNHSFRVNFSFYAPCSNCMSPLLVLLNPGDGRRVIWNSIQNFAAGTNYFTINPTYSGLASCQ